METGKVWTLRGIYQCIYCKRLCGRHKGLDYTGVKAACIGKQTKAAADAYGMQTYMAKKATIESLIELVEETERKTDKYRKKWNSMRIDKRNGSYSETKKIKRQ